ncbi:hypothetical protein BDV93DRAFT_311123 [Ceratobasidium sp. AG-I]|nr:hypothetical protein BDV93DRAFT_311123 [Ceratobasidium sp. AG-I]
MPTAKHSSVLAPVVANRVDLVKLGLPEYRHKFVLVVDNLFTAQDCARYLAAAEASNEWEVAAINGGKPDLQFINTSYRNSGRIMLDDKVLAAEMLSRLRPYLKDIEHMGKSPFHKQLSDNGRFSQDPPARLSRLNERLRFLKYTPDQYFKKHCDGAYYTPDKEEISYYTLQIYLNGSLHESQGGATRIWKPRSAGKQDARKTQPGMPLRDFIDIEPRPGRAFIFEQQGLWHSGEPIKEGIKYTIRTDLFYKVCPVSE